MDEICYKKLIEEIGIEKGDIIDIASDMMTLLTKCRKGGKKFDADRFLDELKIAVGEEGTVMVRTFTWDFCHGVPFDIRTSPSRVGAFGNLAMKREDFRRTKHPIYSWMVCGKYADVLCNIDCKSSFGEGTIFDFLYKNDAKQITLGDAMSTACTQVHHAEAVANVLYRKEKTFSGQYTDEKGNSSIREYSMHVRPLNVDVSNDVLIDGGFLDALIERNILHVGVYDGVISYNSYQLRGVTDFVVDHLVNGDGSLVVSIDGRPGYKLNDIDFSSFKY